MKYNPEKIEKKWQGVWKKTKTFGASDRSKKPKFYCLDMFPYPSADGIHTGHLRGYTFSDIVAKKKKMQGFNVLHPMGWDAFGLPAENYAIKKGVHPAISTKKAIKNMKQQLISNGFGYDWQKEICSCDSDYYKWTQRIFLQLYKVGLAYQKEAKVNFCPSCKTVLANEQVVEEKCERCDSLVEKKYLKQWFFKITKYADKLLSDLNKVDWPENIKIMQKNWIGRSKGTEIKFNIKDTELKINVFTTRVDTLFGCTYMVIAPEHPIIVKLKPKIENWIEVEKYIKETIKKTDIERLGKENKKKTGIQLKEIKAINPINNKEIPVFIADYVLLEYGTGAIMAVPAHDQRDLDFAQKYDIPIKQVVVPFIKKNVREDKKTQERFTVFGIIKNLKTGKVLCLDWKKFGWKSFPAGGVNKGEDVIAAVVREVLEETGYKNLKFIKKIGGEFYQNFYRPHKGDNVFCKSEAYYFELINEEQVKVDKTETEKHIIVWVDEDKVKDFINISGPEVVWDWYLNKHSVFLNEGILINSEQFNGLPSKQAIEKIINWLREKKLGKKAVCYKLRDWLISRQRYWGTPIPIIHCSKCGEMPVSEKDLPIKLPNIKDFKPAGEGKSPLAKSEKFVNVKCPKCNGKAKRETDTLDTFVCSSWYFLRYADPKNKKEFSNKKKIKKWLPVDLYIGGVEHAVLHLLYARFFTKVLKDLGYIDFNEPFDKLFNQGMIYYQGAKMSKSKGNVVSPDEIIERYGADTMRFYECFMGPADQAVEWSDKGIIGCYRFLQKVWKIQDKIQEKKEKTNISQLLHQTIKKVTEDIESFKFNTAISALMILSNEMEKQKNIHILDFKIFILLLAPFVPHFSEEIWSKLGNKKSIFEEKWPKYDSKLIKEEIITLIIQINGKVRDKIDVEANISEEKAKEIATSQEKVLKWIKDKKIKKIIFISGKLINIVI